MRTAKERTHAASQQSYYSDNRALPSSSKSSSFPYQESLAQATFLEYKEATIVDCGQKTVYDLNDVYTHYLGDSFTPRHNGDHRDCTVACSQVLAHCAVSGGFHFRYSSEMAIPRLADSSLVPLIASLNQKPDVCVLRDEEITAVSLVEIHSSPYEDTIRKAIVTGLDLLRLRRTYTSDTAVTTFAFPNLKVSQCVVKVQLRWEDWCFRCSLTPITVLTDLQRHLMATFTEFPSVITGTYSPCTEKFVMRLSHGELGRFGVGSIQEPSRTALIVRNATWVYKKPFWHMDEARLDTVAALLNTATYTNHYAIKLEHTSLDRVLFFRYRTVRHDPLSAIEAKKCLRAFYSGVHTALEKVHKDVKLAHMDIRLNNICFNDACQPIIIDFDRALPNVLRTIPQYGTSCMYPDWVREDRDWPEKFDWIQWGWVIAWVLWEHQYEYHSATFEGLPPHLQASQTLRSLIQDGTCRVSCDCMGGREQCFPFV